MTLKPADLQWSPDGDLRSLEYSDIYFQPGQGVAESHYVFLQHNGIPERFSALKDNQEFCIAELGFGTGLNFLLTAAAWHQRRTSGRARLHYVSIEKHPIRLPDLEKIYAHWPDFKKYTDIIQKQYPPLVGGFHHIDFSDDNMRLTLLFGDVADILPELTGAFDAWYLDGFSPDKNPAMWEEKLFPLIADRTKKGGTVSSFSAAGHVRRGLEASGFRVEKVKGFGDKRHMTMAAFTADSAAEEKLPPRHVAVLGAGLAGASAAYALAQRGVRVTVFDRAPSCAAEASGNPVGVLYPKMTVDPSPLGAFHQHGFCFTRQLLQALQESSWNPCGVTHLDISGEDAHRTKTLFENNTYPEDYAQVLEARGYHQTMAGYVSPPRLCARLLDHPLIDVRYGASCDNPADVEADAVVIALGNNSNKFPATEWMELQSLRGQISYLPVTDATKNMTSVICHDGYVTPAVDGVHYVGATFLKEPPGDTSLRIEEHQENIQKLRHHVPFFDADIKDVIGGRVGFRATTPDKLPMIGSCPDAAAFKDIFAGLRTGKKPSHNIVTPYVPNLYVSTGFGAHGLSGAPLAGEIVAAMITDGVLPIPQSLLAHVLPERFLFRNLKRRKI